MPARDPEHRKAVARVAIATRYARKAAEREATARAELAELKEKKMADNCPACGQGEGAVSVADRRASGGKPNECPRCGMHRPSVAERLAAGISGGGPGFLPSDAPELLAPVKAMTAQLRKDQAAFRRREADAAEAARQARVAERTRKPETKVDPDRRPTVEEVRTARQVADWEASQ